MSLCSEAFDKTDAFAARVSLLIGHVVEGKSVSMGALAGLQIEAFHVVAMNTRARAVLASATADFAKRHPNALQAANENHAPPPETPAPIVA